MPTNAAEDHFSDFPKDVWPSRDPEVRERIEVHEYGGTTPMTVLIYRGWSAESPVLLDVQEEAGQLFYILCGLKGFVERDAAGNWRRRARYEPAGSQLRTPVQLALQKNGLGHLAPEGWAGFCLAICRVDKDGRPYLVTSGPLQERVSEEKALALKSDLLAVQAFYREEYPYYENSLDSVDGVRLPEFYPE